MQSLIFPPRQALKALRLSALVAAAVLLAGLAATRDPAAAQMKETPRVVERGLRGTATFHGPDGLTLAYPRRLFARTFVENGYAGGAEGVVVSNLSRVARVGGPSNGAFPARGVAVEVARLWSAFSRPTADDTRLPLHVSRLRRFPYNQSAQRRPYVRWLPFQVSGQGFIVFTRVGVRASRTDQAAVASIIASIRFPPLASQTFTRSGLYVLGRSARFRNAVTRLDSELPPHYRTTQPPLPLFLIRTGSGFYTLPARASLGHARRTCSLVFDRVAMQFLCRRTDTRWNLAGRVVSPRRAPADWNLDRVRAPVSSDGYLLVVLYQTAPPR